MSRVFRNDDVCSNTDLGHLHTIVSTIRRCFPQAELWLGVTAFSKHSLEGSVYPTPPFRGNPKQAFYEVDEVVGPDLLGFLKNSLGDVTLCSHGVWHLNHAELGYELQEASIVSSCRYLKTNIFVPPFNQWNSDTQDVCRKHRIRLIKQQDGWRSLEWNDFDPDHPLWYFHGWRWKGCEFEAKLSGGDSSERREHETC
jgi:hypothetical protein